MILLYLDQKRLGDGERSAEYGRGSVVGLVSPHKTRYLKEMGIVSPLKCPDNVHQEKFSWEQTTPGEIVIAPHYPHHVALRSGRT